MNYKIIKTILRKELLETLRDRRTLFAMVGLPIIMYPMVFLIMTQVTIIQQNKLDAMKSRVAIIGAASGQISSWLKSAATEETGFSDPNKAQEILSNITITELDNEKADELQKALTDGDQEKNIPTISLLEMNLDSVMLVEQLNKPQTDGSYNLKLSILYDNTTPSSEQARKRLATLLDMYREIQKNKRLEALGLNISELEPVILNTKDIAPLEKTMGSIIGRILPMLIIISLAVAAFYPALDLTAGEKERGTFETLLSTPTRKTEIVTGKFLAIFTLAMITAGLSLGSMVLTIIGQMSQLANAAGAGLSPVAALKISPATVLVMLAVLIPLAFFICSAMMSIALFARNIQEAQHYVTPFYLCIIMPAAIAAIPTIELTKFTVMLPIINVSLLFKELLMGNFDLESIGAVFISISSWALLTLTVAVRLFQSEQLILSQEKGLPLTLRRSLIKPSERPGISMALGLFAFCLLGLFYIGSYFQSRDMISGIIITEWVIVLVPVLTVLWFYKVDIKKTLSLKLPRWYELILSLVLILASYIIVLWLGMEQEKYMPIPKSLSEMAEKLIGGDGTWHSIFIELFAIALSAAVCEEILFRGVVLSGLRQPGKNALLAITITALLFAIMHLSFYRLITTFVLGMIMGYLTWRTGSIFNSMLAHFVNNALPVLVLNGKLPVLHNWLKQFENTNPNSPPAQIGWPVILAALTIITLVIVIMEQIHKNRNRLQNCK